MKSLIALFLLVNLNTFADQAVCEQLSSSQNDDEFEFRVLGSVDVLSKDVWYKTDVVLNFSYEECHSAVRQELIEFNGKEYYRFRTVEDYCDGGNTYGAIYSKDLKTPIAHIYDSDIYCKGSWSKDEMYENNKCNVKAMELAEKKMQEFGIPFKATHARIELRDPYTYDFIHIEGNMTEGEQKSVALKALVRLEECKFSSVSISNLRL